MLVITVVRAAQLLTGMLVKEVKPLWLLYAAAAAVVLYLISLIDIFVQTSGTDRRRWVRPAAPPASAPGSGSGPR